ncbi:hypothetical protein O181_049502, partial [Austropuccinia psidii MF-1]|nr:hypothetical protein [Austropuccinia psidii MF-1]
SGHIRESLDGLIKTVSNHNHINLDHKDEVNLTKKSQFTQLILQSTISNPKEPKEDHLPKSCSQLSSPQKFSLNLQNQPQSTSASPSLTLFTSPNNPLQLTTINPTSKSSSSNHKHSPSLLYFQNRNRCSNSLLDCLTKSLNSATISDCLIPSNSNQFNYNHNSQYSNQSQHDQIIANTHTNSSSMTPIDFLQKSHQPMPFLDQAPDITSLQPLPISFSTFNSSNHSESENKSSNRKSSLHRHKSSLESHHYSPLLVSRPIYKENRCTITI